ncbi:hypothetical protein BT93_A0487 [Corymbia citriodora subsp. variegata]|nr:hypothetical protein BT93_A0487 [Corymbia citriodora subsp. variegata]
MDGRESSGLYAVGFMRRGLFDAFPDTIKIAQDIGMEWKEEMGQKKTSTPTHRRCIFQF